ncbi:uncharacterized protein LOC142531364 [Primulina tabacum]|uniref:uncharacterized protein LOC142531364 n=1 Tax=Primulina tabacum TaxID=48773 RepID=UPI003F59CC07
MNLHAPEWSGEVRSITYSPHGKSVSIVYRVTLYGTDAEVIPWISVTSFMDFLLVIQGFSNNSHVVILMLSMLLTMVLMFPVLIPLVQSTSQLGDSLTPSQCQQLLTFLTAQLRLGSVSAQSQQQEEPSV